jgi:anti-sigma factor RsiW
MVTDGETWQLGHRIAESSGQARSWWERHPVTVVRPAEGEATVRLLCATCDAPVECVVPSTALLERRLRWRRRRAAFRAWLTRIGVVLLGTGAAGALFGGFAAALGRDWLEAVMLLPTAILYGWLATLLAPHVHRAEAGPRAGEDVRPAVVSPAHELTR